LVVDQVNIKTKEENKRIDKIEKGFIATYNRIPNNAQAVESSTMENIVLIVM